MNRNRASTGSGGSGQRPRALARARAAWRGARRAALRSLVALRARAAQLRAPQPGTPRPAAARDLRALRDQQPAQRAPAPGAPPAPAPRSAPAGARRSRRQATAGLPPAALLRAWLRAAQRWLADALDRARACDPRGGRWLTAGWSPRARGASAHARSGEANPDPNPGPDPGPDEPRRGTSRRLRPRAGAGWRPRLRAGERWRVRNWALRLGGAAGVTLLGLAVHALWSALAPAAAPAPAGLAALAPRGRSSWSALAAGVAPLAAPPEAAAEPAPLDAADQAALARAYAELPVSARAFEQLVPDARGQLGIELPGAGDAATGAPLEIGFSLQRELSQRVFALLESSRVELGHVIVADARTGRLLVYASTDPERFPAQGLYPAASLVKVVTAAATLRRAPDLIDSECQFRGSPYRLSRALITPPVRGTSSSFRRALAMSNNQCFAQLAVHALGPGPLLRELAAFGWLESPAPGHPAGRVTTGGDAYDVGQLGSGLAGSEITPLHAAQLALLLATGRVQQPYWIERVALGGRELRLPERGAGRRVLEPAAAARLRELLTDTTRSGTARRAFSNRGRPLLAPLAVAGKTGSLNGTHPAGRYEWFVGVAPAEDPRIAIAVVTVHQSLWWRSASQLSAEVLRQIFCPAGVCSPEASERWLTPEAPVSVPRSKPSA